MPNNRMYFLDNLRALVVLLVVVLHTSMTYMAYAPTWWYVLDSQNSIFFTMLVLIIDVPLMPIMFFIAGYFSFPTLQKKGGGVFLKDKLIRIGIPWVFGALFLAPPTAYMIYYSRHVPMSFFKFWATDFWGDLYQQSVYWFLGVLLLMFLILTIAFLRSGWFRALKQKVSLPSWKSFSVFLTLMTCGFFLMYLFFSIDQWSHIYLFVFQPLRVPLYFGYFFLGVYAYLHAWFTPDGYKPRLAIWAGMFILFGIIYLSYKLSIASDPQATILIKIGTAVLFNLFCLSSLMAGIAFFQRYVNYKGRIWKSLSANSYGIYYVHTLILYPFAYIFLDVSLPLFLKSSIVMLVAALMSWGISAMLLKKIPGLRAMF